MTKPLEDIRILDFTRYQQGPYATMMLADMGAEVLKIEAPRGGDYGRRLLTGPDGFSGFFEALNRGKKSLCIDLREPEGRDIALELGASCDIIVENFRVGTMDGWGLGTEPSKPSTHGSFMPQPRDGVQPATLPKPLHSTRLPRHTVVSLSIRAAGRTLNR